MLGVRDRLGVVGRLGLRSVATDQATGGLGPGGRDRTLGDERFDRIGKFVLGRSFARKSDAVLVVDSALIANGVLSIDQADLGGSGRTEQIGERLVGVLEERGLEFKAASMGSHLGQGVLDIRIDCDKTDPTLEVFLAQLLHPWRVLLGQRAFRS